MRLSLAVSVAERTPRWLVISGGSAKVSGRTGVPSPLAPVRLLAQPETTIAVTTT